MIRKETKVRYTLSTFSITKKEFIGKVVRRSRKLAWIKPERFKGSFLPKDRRTKVCLSIYDLEVIG